MLVFHGSSFLTALPPPPTFLLLLQGNVEQCQWALAQANRRKILNATDEEQLTALHYAGWGCQMNFELSSPALTALLCPPARHNHKEVIDYLFRSAGKQGGGQHTEKTGLVVVVGMMAEMHCQPSTMPNVPSRLGCARRGRRDGAAPGVFGVLRVESIAPLQHETHPHPHLLPQPYRRPSTTTPRP